MFLVPRDWTGVMSLTSSGCDLSALTSQEEDYLMRMDVDCKGAKRNVERHAFGRQNDQNKSEIQAMPEEPEEKEDPRRFVCK